MRVDPDTDHQMPGKPEGIDATETQVLLLLVASRLPGLDRPSRALLKVRVARWHTLRGHNAQAHAHFVTLHSLLVPKDRVESCWVHINYGVCLRRAGPLKQTIHHQPPVCPRTMKEWNR